MLREGLESIAEPNKLLADLAHHPGWEELRKLVKQRMEQHFRQLAHEFTTKDARPDYANLQWHRGAFAGMKFLLDNPTVEAAKLERLLRKEDSGKEQQS